MILSGKGEYVMIVREHYIRQIRPFYESDLVKIITGIRRCGKSVIMDQIREELESQGKRTIKLDFEKREVSAAITTDLELIRFVKEHQTAEKLYVFLDEIQTLENWNLAVKSLRLENMSIFITGSNSKLLSREFTKELSGRYVSFCIRPFVYKEMLQYALELGKTVTVNDYLIYGGFPKILEFENKSAVLRYLNDLDETIVINDIIRRYRIKKEQVFRRLVNYVLISNSRIFSGSSVQRYLEGQNIKISVATVMKYMSYLEEAYIIRKIPQYSTKAKRELNYYLKIYNEDVAFNTIRQKAGRYDLTHNLENIIYNELFYMGYELSVFHQNNREIDFLAEKENKQYLIQVAYSIVEEETYNREFALFNVLDQSRRKIIITNDEVDFSTSTVEHIPLSKFLMLDQLA